MWITHGHAARGVAVFVSRAPPPPRSTRNKSGAGCLPRRSLGEGGSSPRTSPRVVPRGHAARGVAVFFCARLAGASPPATARLIAVPGWQARRPGRRFPAGGMVWRSQAMIRLYLSSRAQRGISPCFAFVFSLRAPHSALRISISRSSPARGKVLLSLLGGGIQDCGSQRRVPWSAAGRP